MTLTTTYITSTREPRHIAHATCPSCSVPKVGISFHGVLATGDKVYQIVAHSPGRRAVKNGEPRCVGTERRMTVTPDGWRPAP